MGEEQKNILDLCGIEDYPKDSREDITQARIQARQIIDALEPAHIGGWSDLFAKLASAFEQASRYYVISRFAKNERVVKAKGKT